ncbi:hypothetical protein A1O1_09132 [Capronia coronata CBS 617.96]|uniref:Uncharacterized protein n=1 Tax=Capronia coronata CBS 617.96 TaxID=1182541 RepID=W9XN18_9EURO|nr:uncharacterized protein A1O1_09132 [Capronia coronata CBS 617.96]EXJ78730.1 hypothetical protein A1O1_09132 [Capronia coronata CBS 617.96]
MRLTTSQLFDLADREQQGGTGPVGDKEGDSDGEHDDDEPDPDVIYYIKTTTPHIRDVSVSGPYSKLEDVLEQLLVKVRIAKSKDAERTLDEMVYSGQAPALVHLSCPLPDGNIMKLELLKQKNPEVARHLPGSVWYIIVATPFLDRTALGRSGCVPVQDLDLYETFTTKEAANAAASRLLKWLKAEEGVGALMQELVGDGGRLNGFVMSADRRSTRMVQVNHDDGRINQVDEHGNPL